MMVCACRNVFACGHIPTRMPVPALIPATTLYPAHRLVYLSDTQRFIQKTAFEVSDTLTLATLPSATVLASAHPCFNPFSFRHRCQAPILTMPCVYLVSLPVYPLLILTPHPHPQALDATRRSSMLSLEAIEPSPTARDSQALADRQAWPSSILARPVPLVSRRTPVADKENPIEGIAMEEDDDMEEDVESLLRSQPQSDQQPI